MLGNKGMEKSQEESIWFIIKIVLVVVGMAALGVFLLGGDPGCGRHDDDTGACIRDPECKPTARYEGVADLIDCERAVRTPNHRFDASKDPECHCPDPPGEDWFPEDDEESDYYGMCYKIENGNYHYYPCQYGLDITTPEVKEGCNGQVHGERWSDSWTGTWDKCCDDGEVKSCSGYTDSGKECAVYECKRQGTLEGHGW